MAGGESQTPPSPCQFIDWTSTLQKTTSEEGVSSLTLHIEGREKVSRDVELTLLLFGFK